MKKFILKGCGGCGMTYVMSKYGKNIIDVEKYGKHSKNYGDGVTPILYLYADPLDVVLSFARRGFLYPAVYQLDGNVEMLESLNIKTEGEGFDSLTLKDYVSRGIDLLELQEHFDFFNKAPQKVFFIKYDVLKDEKRIRKLLGIKSTVSHNHITPRKSDIRNHSLKTIAKVGLIYGSWSERFNKLKDIIIINN